MENQNAVRDFEVRCYHCGTSFAVGTKRCIHCGQRLGSAPVEVAYGGTSSQAPEEEVVKSSPLRSVMWVLMAIIAVAMSVARSCEG